jgi:predicted ATPase/predicted Ser/Thr protein kinase
MVALAREVDALCDRFEDVLFRGETADLTSWLPPTEPLRGAALFELARIELEYRLRAGETVRVEEYFARYPELAADTAKAQKMRAIEQYAGRGATGQEPTPFRLGPAEVPGGEHAEAGHTGPAEKPAIPGYEVLEELGRGGMGVVYKARETSLNRHIALKFLPAEYAGDQDRLGRFLREARTASALNHPHICTVHALGEHEGRPFIVMEFIEGLTLQALAARRPQTDEVARLVGQAAQALAAAHAAGVVHRDIKPENVMVRADGYVKVLDFGLARRLPAFAQPGPDGMRDTVPGELLGTVAYMSPEQARGAAVDCASDIFSLGIVLYQLVSGRHPFEAGSALEMLFAIRDRQPSPLSQFNPHVPAALDGLIDAMLHKDALLRPTAATVADALAALAVPTAGAAAPAAPPRTIIHRHLELAALRAALVEAEAGRGAVVCLSGEPGIGKTTLVEDFLSELALPGRAFLIVRGHCSERLAGSEPYLPVIDGLQDLLRGKSGEAVARLLKVIAPTWHTQVALPGAVLGQESEIGAEPEHDAAPFPRTPASSQQAMLREFCNLLREVSRLAPVVLFIDDVHWADLSTVDLLAHLGRLCPHLRVLVLATYRRTELLLGPHPFYHVKLELEGKGVCTELALGFLGLKDIDTYLELVFPGHAFPDDFAGLIHARTEGSPLFMADLLCYLRERGVITQAGGRWALVRDLPDLRRELPNSVRSMIQRKLDQLGEADRRLLAAASVQGPAFDSAIVAQVFGREAADVEERLDVLERVHGLVRLVREQSFPDGALTVRYGFVHVLYQNALYAALQPTRKAAWSAAAARALLSHYGEKSAGLAAELAELFEVGRDHERAIDYYQIAAENAARIFAHHEAVALAQRGLAVLQALPDTLERARRELPFQLTLGIQLQVVQGYAAPEAGRSYARARTLCEQSPEDPLLFLVLWGLWMFHEVRSDLGKSRELAEQLFALGQRTQDPAQLLQARMALAVTSFSLGDPAATREHAEQAVALYDPRRHGSHTHLYGQDPKVACLAFEAVAVWILGYPNQARRLSREAVALGGELGHPTSRALALYFDTMLRQYGREAPAVQENALATTAIATEHGLSLWLANGLVMRGWALAEQGACASGIAMLRQGLNDWVATGAETHRTYFLGLLAEALGRGRQIEEALDVLAEALAMMHGTGTVFHRAELHRLQGEFLLRQEAVAVVGREVEACFLQAVAIALQQQAKSLELRAVMSLTRLYQKQNRQAEARPMLAACYAWFTEGFDTPDLQEAKALLEMLS